MIRGRAPITAKAMGLDVVHNVRIQHNVHNKGIIVGGAAVLVSSQNWSADGTLYNRDADAIIYQQDAAQPRSPTRRATARG